MDRKKLPIGVYDFARLIGENYYFVDKSLLIKELLDSGAAVTLLPRPRRFGKTVNMSMLNYFFEKTELTNRHLFDGLKIAEHPECMAQQGQYPIIFLTFKGVKERSWTDIFPSIKDVIEKEFDRHGYLSESQAISELQRRKFQAIIDGEGTATDYKNSLLLLSACLYKHHQKRPIILIDEYDAPIHAAFEYRYYEDVVIFMRNFLSGGFKDNPNLAFGVLTGILRVAKESIFSGLNNLAVDTMLSDSYADKFGLQEDEVTQMLAYFDVSEELARVRHWYDGYQSGNHKLYNPWSIINFIKYRKFEPYWVNTSDNALLKRVMQNGPDRLKIDLEQLLQGIPVTKPINQNIVLPDIMTDESAAWGLLLMSGYLTFENLRPDPNNEGVEIAEFKMPNAEVASIYKTQILSWFKIGGSDDDYQSLLRSLIDGKIEEFQELFDAFVSQTLSVFDVTGRNPERFYHGLVLGMLASLRDSHEVVSNRESGTGRYDVSIFPRDVKKPGIIIEFKVTSKYRQETLETAAENALKQIEDRQYEAAMRARGITNIIKLGISFAGKKHLVLVKK